MRSKLNLLRPLIAMVLGCALAVGAIGLVIDGLAGQPAVAAVAGAAT